MYNNLQLIHKNLSYELDFEKVILFSENQLVHFKLCMYLVNKFYHI